MNININLLLTEPRGIIKDVFRYISSWNYSTDNICQMMLKKKNCALNASQCWPQSLCHCINRLLLITQRGVRELSRVEERRGTAVLLQTCRVQVQTRSRLDLSTLHPQPHNTCHMSARLTFSCHPPCAHTRTRPLTPTYFEGVDFTAKETHCGRTQRSIQGGDCC